jgi:hypothetical protein
MTSTIRFAATAAVLLLSTAAVAAPKPAATPQRAEAAWRWLDQAMAPTLNAEQRGKLVWAAYNNAAGSLCNEVTVDDAKLGALLTGLLPPEDDPKTTPEQRDHLQLSLMLHLGAATGIFAAENADKLPSFCAEAVALRDDPASAGKHLFLPRDDDDDGDASKP